MYIEYLGNSKCFSVKVYLTFNLSQGHRNKFTVFFMGLLVSNFMENSCNCSSELGSEISYKKISDHVTLSSLALIK